MDSKLIDPIRTLDSALLALLIAKYRQHRRFSHSVSDDRHFIDCAACAVWERRIARFQKGIEKENDRA